VIDSDYQVVPHWLRSVMPGFADPQVGIVQAPQDYRDANENLFKSFLYEEYTGFFHIGMVERAEHNAIIQHGTMCVIRREAMERIGGWAEWCITRTPSSACACSRRATPLSTRRSAWAAA